MFPTHCSLSRDDNNVSLFNGRGLTFKRIFIEKIAEAVVKMIGLRHHYFTLPWNLFDLILVSASIVGLIMEDVLNEFPISPTLLRVVRVFRLGRVLRLVKVSFLLFY